MANVSASENRSTRRVTITHGECAVGEDEHGPGQDRAPSASAYVVQSDLGHGSPADRIARAFDRTGEHGLGISLPSPLLRGAKAWRWPSSSAVRARS